MTMEENNAIGKLERPRALIAKLHGMSADSPEFTRWKRDSELAIEHVFGTEGRHQREFAQVRYYPGAYNSSNQRQAFAEAFARGLGNAEAVLSSMIDELKEYGLPETARAAPGSESAATLSRLCRRFPAVASQLLQA